VRLSGSECSNLLWSEVVIVVVIMAKEVVALSVIVAQRRKTTFGANCYGSHSNSLSDAI